MALHIADFPAFFREVHGLDPFPWQNRLLIEIVNSGGKWPSQLDLPTGSGKTAAIDVAIFHLALDVDRSSERTAPVRIAFVVDRRLVVDDAYTRARNIELALADPPGPVAGLVAQQLRKLAGDGPPLLVRVLRGGLPREDDWARTPAQPTVLCSTVDQVGSRLLFRGYGVSDAMKPVHAGLLGADCLILLDEAHLAEPFRQTLEWVSTYRGERWRDSRSHASPFGVATLTATPRVDDGANDELRPFGLTEEDRANETLQRRLGASKLARLVRTESSRGAGLPEDEDNDERDAEHRGLEAFVAEVQQALSTLRAEGVGHPAICVVVNRVGRARVLFERLRSALPESRDAMTLMIGPARPVDRRWLVQVLEPIRTKSYEPDHQRVLGRAVILVATQCIEAGVDIDFDALITEAAPLDALRQRFGRLNRAGRNVTAYGAVIGLKSVLQSKKPDPVYGAAIRAAWDYLTTHATADAKGKIPTIDFGIDAFGTLLSQSPPPAAAMSPRSDAPVLLPAHLDLLWQTSPVPSADPDMALYLHGPNRQPDSVTVIWRGDLRMVSTADLAEDNERIRRLLTLLPPRSAEAVQLPVWTVQRWLNRQHRQATSELADVAGEGSEVAQASSNAAIRSFRWRGDDEASGWILPSEIRPGDTIVVPTRVGGLDEFGWNPVAPGESDGGIPVRDMGDEVARPYARRRFVVRVAPELVGDGVTAEALAETIASAPHGWLAVRDALLELPLSDEMRIRLRELDKARQRRRVAVVDDVYGENQGRPRGVILIAPLGLAEPDGVLGDTAQDENQVPSTEDDVAGSVVGFPLSLDHHTADVVEQVGTFAALAALPVARVNDLRVAATLHDLGKFDPRFQAWMRSSDPLGADLDEAGQVLAKSGRRLTTQARTRAGLPDRWRHEALSVRIACQASALNEADDPELVVWLIGTHHGHGRPLFPHTDPADLEVRALPVAPHLPPHLEPGVGPQSLAFNWHALDWASLGERLKARYGVWELARMEAILRLADHRASDEEVRRIPVEHES